jgi:hypothetical protein
MIKSPATCKQCLVDAVNTVVAERSSFAVVSRQLGATRSESGRLVNREACLLVVNTKWWCSFCSNTQRW